MSGQRLLLLCAAPFLTACAAAPQVDPVAERAALETRSRAVAAAEGALNADAAIAFWAADAVLQPAGSPQVQGRQAIANLYRQYFESGMLKEFSGTTTSIEVAASGDLAYEYGVNRMVLRGPNGDLLDMGKYLAVWKKIDGTWYVSALSFTSDAAAPVPLSQ